MYHYRNTMHYVNLTEQEAGLETWERGYTVTSYYSLLEDRVEALECPLTLVQAVLAKPLEGIQLLLIILEEETEGGKHTDII